jgi:nicotinamidase-related amidase
MQGISHIQRSLINVDDSVLVIIDIQDYFLKKYDQAKTQKLLSNVTWLLEVAKQLNVPVVAMAEDIKYCGTLNQMISDALPEGTTIHDKDFFGLAANPEIMAAVESTTRKTAICVGMETDVCVAQSALGLIDKGYSVVTLLDAVCSMDADEEIGLMRMRDAGVAVSSVKALYFEWLRGVSPMHDMKAKLDALETQRPTTIVL